MKKRYLVFAWFIVFAAHPLFSLAQHHVQQVAPGIYFRQQDQGCNNGWIILKDYVVVIDANFPHHAEKVVAAIKKTTSKPIRFVLDTHHHGDHIFGNGIFAREGAVAVASSGFKQVDRDALRRSFQQWTRNHPAYKDLPWIEPSLLFDRKLVLDDGDRRIEFHTFGHGHTAGDAVAYLPREKILFSGDLCVNGAYNYMGNAFIDRWIEILEILQGMDINTVCPGHGAMESSDLLQTQKEYFVVLRKQVQDLIDQGKTLAEITQLVNIPFYQQWTGVPPRESNIREVYRLLTGLRMPWALAKLNLQEGPSPTQDTPGWTPPKKFITRRLSNKDLAALKRIAPDMQFINVRTDEDAMEVIDDADGMMGPINQELFAKAKKIRWVHSRSAGVDRYLFPEFVESDVILTNSRGIHGPPISDHVIGFMLMFSKGLAHQHERKIQGKWGQDRRTRLQDLEGKTLLILGLGGIGKQIAIRASGMGMNIWAVDPKSMDKPDYVKQLVPPEKMYDLLPGADFVACTVPLTKHTNRYFNKKCFDLMKPTAYFINIGRGRVVQQDDLVEALRNHTIAGAALDVTDPEPLPADHPLWDLDNVILTPHMSGRTQETGQRRWYLLRENVRRFAQGLPLLNVVNKSAGY